METGRSTARVASFSRHRGEQGGLGYPPGAWKAKPSGPAAPPEAARKGASHKRGGIGDAAAAAMGARGPAVGTNAARALTSASHRPRLCSAGLARPRCDGRPATERRAGAGAGAQGPCPLARRRLTQFPFALSQTCPRAHAHRRPPNPHPRVPSLPGPCAAGRPWTPRKWGRAWSSPGRAATRQPWEGEGQGQQQPCPPQRGRPRPRGGAPAGRRRRSPGRPWTRGQRPWLCGVGEGRARGGGRRERAERFAVV